MDYNKIWDLASQKKITKKDLAFQLGVTPNGLRNMATVDTMTVSNLEKISEILGVSICYWWRDEKAAKESGQSMYITGPDQQFMNRDAFNALMNNWDKEREFYKSQIEFMQNLINQNYKSKAG